MSNEPRNLTINWKDLLTLSRVMGGAINEESPSRQSSYILEDTNAGMSSWFGGNKEELSKEYDIINSKVSIQKY